MTENSPLPSHLAQRITFSPATPDDFVTLAEFRIAAMRASLENVGRFDPARARERLRNSFYPEHTRFILLDARRIGFYTFRPAEDGFQLDHLYLHPGVQSQGIGSYVLGQLIAEADRCRLPVHLGALKESPANRFYQHHGFMKQREDEWDIYYTRPADRTPGS